MKTLQKTPIWLKFLSLTLVFGLAFFLPQTLFAQDGQGTTPTSEEFIPTSEENNTNQSAPPPTGEEPPNIHNQESTNTSQGESGDPITTPSGNEEENTIPGGEEEPQGQEPTNQPNNNDPDNSLGSFTGNPYNEGNLLESCERAIGVSEEAILIRKQRLRQRLAGLVDPVKMWENMEMCQGQFDQAILDEILGSISSKITDIAWPGSSVNIPGEDGEPGQNHAFASMPDFTSVISAVCEEIRSNLENDYETHFWHIAETFLTELYNLYDIRPEATFDWAAILAKFMGPVGTDTPTQDWFGDGNTGTGIDPELDTRDPGAVIEGYMFPALEPYWDEVQRVAEEYGIELCYLTSRSVRGEGNPNYASGGLYGLFALPSSVISQFEVTNPFDPIQSMEAFAKWTVSLREDARLSNTGTASYNTVTLAMAYVSKGYNGAEVVGCRAGTHPTPVQSCQVRATPEYCLKRDEKTNACLQYRMTAKYPTQPEEVTWEYEVLWNYLNNCPNSIQ